MPEPSVSIQNGSSVVGMERAGAVVIAVFRLSKAVWQSLVQRNSFLSEVSTLRGHTILEKSLTNLR